MTTRSFKFHLALAASLALATGATATILMVRPAHAITVFDPWNYKENLLTAIRSLTEIENQVKQLTNEAQMLMKMDLNLEQLGSSVAGDLKDSMGEIKSLLDQANGIAMDVKETEDKIKDLFPDDYATALTNDQSLSQAKTRWDETLTSSPPCSNPPPRIPTGPGSPSCSASSMSSRPSRCGPVGLSALLSITTWSSLLTPNRP
jgi:P-type conjugative transfer protein TrbJ